ATDAAGNTGTASTSGTVDTTAPTVTLDAQGTGNDTTPTISGTTDLPAGESVTLTVTDANGDAQTVTATVQPDGTFSADVPAEMAEGNFTVEAAATDAAGNTGTASTSGNIDTTSPTVTLDAQGTGNDTTPTISGTTDLPAGESVTLTVTDANGDAQTVTATVQPDGTFSADVPAEMAEGNFTVDAAATDAAGNTGMASTSGNIDTTAPTVTLDAQGTGNDTTPTISGTTDLPAGESVTLTVTDANGDAQTVTATVQPDGTFSADMPAEMAEGNFTVDAAATDAAGNTGTASTSGTVDTTAPTVTLDAQGTGNDTTPTISGTTDLPAGEFVTLTVTDANGDAQTVTATVQPDGTFSADVPAEMAEGNFTVDAAATDAAGNTGTASTSGTVDTTAPTVTLDAQGTGNDTTPTISGTTDLPAGESVTLTVTDANGDAQTVTATVQPDGTFSADVPAEMAEGNFTVDAAATDAAGNTGTASTSGTVDTTAPTVTLDAQGTGNDTTPTISGTTDLPAGESVTLTVTDANGAAQTVTATVQPDGTFSADVPAEMAEGNFTVDAAATDAAGNTGTASTTGTVDTTAPTVTLDAQGTGNDTTPTISGTTDLPAGESVTLTVTDANGDAQTVTATVQPDGTFSADVPAEMAEGNFTVDAAATDAAGNTGTASTSGTVDTTAPTVTLDAQGTGNDTTPTISGTTDLPAGEFVTLTVTDANGDAQTVTATVQPDGTFSADVPAEMAEGNFTVDAAATDAAGNTGTASTSGTVDTTAPTVTLDAQGTGNDTTPTISGTTDLPAGESVTLTVTDANGDAQTVTATVQPDGTFSADVPAEMAEGNFTVDAAATDAAGNTGTASTSGNIDTTAPVVTLDAEGLGNDATPTISGTTDLTPGEAVTLAVTDANGDVQTFTATVQPDGTFSADVPANMADGNYTVDASATDAAGNTGSTSTSGEVDTTAPTGNVVVTTTYDDATPMITGTLDIPEGDIVTLVITDAAGNEQTLTVPVAADGSFSVEVPTDLAEGEFTVQASATDDAGNTATATLTATIDMAAPSLIIDPIDITNDNSPTVTGSTDVGVGTIVLLTVTDSDGVEYNLSAVVQADGSWSSDLPILPDGSVTVEAQVLDDSGNIVNVSAAGTIDTTDPGITLDTFVNTNDVQPTISGTSDELGANVEIVLVDGLGVEQTLSATVQPDGTWSVNVPSDLNEGLLTIDASVMDDAGNVATVSTSGLIDLTLPVLNVNPVTDLGSDTPLISGTSDEIGGIVTIDITDGNGDTQSFNATVLGDGTWSANVPVAISEGLLDVNVSVLDAAGNVATVNTSGLIDLTLPVLNINPITDLASDTPLISGTSDEIGGIVTIDITDGNGDTQSFNATVLGDGTWSANVPMAISEGLLDVNVSVLDDAGNLATVNTSGLIDLTLPVLNINPITDLASDTPLISGTSDEIGGLVTIDITDGNGDTQSFNATVLGDGTWSA
ncbi:Ig-like domain repeat protein, partial [Alteromonas sp. NFXS44]|uniref:beta strand repeat-containing protein n=1 Tax=Alteromonas sp. NFXS44 TaxID=2818435 RepID=UPI0032DECB22